MGLAYATSPIGGSHMRGDPAYFELFNIPEPMDPHQWKGKAKVVRAFQDLSSILDSAGICIFFTVRNLVKPNLQVQPDGIMNYLNTVTGADYTLDELIMAGQRVSTAERLFLQRAGFSRKDDSLPDRLTKQPMPKGPSKGLVCHLDEMLDEYYQEQNWDENGHPTLERLKELGLS
jgi:aldehyde:ferredoxin oxidoreductase